MYQGVLFEDDIEAGEYLCERITQQFSLRNEIIQLILCDHGTTFLQTADEHISYDVFFLDIEMPGLDGIALAKRLREIYPNTPMVFVSSHESLVFNTFEVEPFRFIRKGQFEVSLAPLVSDLLIKLKKNGQRTIYLTEPGTGDIYSFYMSDLHYIEAQRKDCRLRTRDRDVYLRCQISVLEKQLEKWSFIKCHRSYLVNWRCIFLIGKNTIRLTNGEEIPLSRAHSNAVRLAFMRIVTAEG